MLQAKFHKRDGLLDYLNGGTAVVSGQVVVVTGGIVGVVNGLRGIAANEVGTLAIDGHFDFVKKTGAMTVGQLVYWDPTGDPVGGTAGTGAATVTAAAAYTSIGICEVAAASGDQVVRVHMTNRLGMQPATVIAAVATAAATDLTTTEALANALQTKLNATLAALKAAGLMDAA